MKYYKMNKRCTVLNCPNAIRREKKKKIHFFRFPQVEAITIKWIEATGRNNWIPTEHSVICNLHFREEDFSATKVRKRLKVDVVPTLYIHRTLDMQTEDTTGQGRKRESESLLQDYMESTVTKRLKANIPHIFTETEDTTGQAGNRKDENLLQGCTESTVTKRLKANITQTEDTTGQAGNRKDENFIQLQQCKIAKLQKQLDQLKAKIVNLETENNELKIIIQSWEEKFDEKFENRVNVLQKVYQEKQNIFHEKLATKNKQLKSLRSQAKRKDNKINALLTKALH